MRYWNTPDEVTNSNLSFLESIALDRDPPFDVDRLNDKFIFVIEVMEMLPMAVRKHFHVSLLIGGLAAGWAPDRRNQKASELCDGLAMGLESVAADAELHKRGGAYLSDRPQSRGEAILAALRAFKERFPSGRYHTELSAVRSAAYGSSLQRNVTEVDRILSRKSWNSNTSQEYEVLRQINEMEFAAKRYHRQKA